MKQWDELSIPNHQPSTAAMKYIVLLTLSALACSAPVMAQNIALQSLPQDPSTQTMEDPVMTKVIMLQSEWARIKYRLTDEDAQIQALRALEESAAALGAAYPQRAEPQIWAGIILATDAGISGGFSALGKVNEAKRLFESSLQLDPKALNGSAQTSLGSLYYQVPGWPIGFGDDTEAERQLRAALEINPGGIDPNYFYADFLYHDGRYGEAQRYLERALAAPPRPGRELADAGRRGEIQVLSAEVRAKLADAGNHSRQD